MKFLLWFFLLSTSSFIFSCDKKSSPENRIYFAQSKNACIDTSTKNRIYLSTNFWQYFFNKYPASSFILFLNIASITDSNALKNGHNCFTPAKTIDMKRLENLLPNDASLSEKEVRFPMFSFFVISSDSIEKNKKNLKIQNHVPPTLTKQISNDYQLFKKMLFDTAYKYRLYYKPIISDSILFWININNIKKANTPSGQWNLY